MFETIFAPYAAHRHRSAPLLLEREEFLTYLQRRGTGSGCLRVYASRLNQIVRFLKLKRPRLCKALLDRVTDRAHIIETGTESYRFRRTVEGRQKKKAS